MFAERRSALFEVIPLGEATLIVCRNGALICGLIGIERAVLVMGAKFFFTGRYRHQLSNHVGFHDDDSDSIEFHFQYADSITAVEALS
jgi:hypothetical protein